MEPARLAFGRDGIINMSTGAPFDDNAQSPGSLYGKVLRVTDGWQGSGGQSVRGQARPDGYLYLYLITDEEDGLVLKVEPAK